MPAGEESKFRAESGKDSFIAGLYWCQFSVLWWNRAWVQLAGQSLCEHETFTMCGLWKRWRMLELVCVDEGPRFAKELDRATWGAAVATMSSGGVVEPRSLAKLDHDMFQKVKRQLAGKDALQ